MPTYTETKIRFWGKGSNQVYKWAQDGDEGVFFARVFGYDYENATEEDWDEWEYEFDSYRVGNMCCNATKCDDNTILLDMIVIGTPPHGVFKEIAERFPQIHADGLFIMQDEEFFGNLVIENGGYLWTKFDNPGRRSGERNFRFESFFYDLEEDQNRFPDQKAVLDLLRFDRDNMRSLLAEGKGFFKRRKENKPQEVMYNSKFFFSEQELKAIAGDADSQFELAREMLDGEYYDNNPEIYNKRNKIERECCNQFFDEMGDSWLEKAAMNGSRDALYRMFEHMYNTEVLRDTANWIIENRNSQDEIEKAIVLLETARELGESDATDDLARIYAFGEIVEKDVPKALKYLEETASDGDMYSKMYLFACSECGIYSFPSESKRKEYESESPLEELAECFTGEDAFATALGIEKDSDKYFKWLSRAVVEYRSTDYNGALFRLGKAFYEGKLIKQDYKKAFDCFIPSAFMKEELVDSCYYLGLMYLNGEYLPKNVFMAEKWFLIGTKRSNHKEESKELLDKVRQQIKTEQLIKDKKELARFKEFENAVNLVYIGEYAQAIASFYVLGDFLDSSQRMEYAISQLLEQFYDGVFDDCYWTQEILNTIPRELEIYDVLSKELEEETEE